MARKKKDPSPPPKIDDVTGQDAVEVLDVEIPEVLRPGLSIIHDMMGVVNSGEPISPQVEQRLAAFMADLQPHLDVLRVASLPLQLSRLFRLNSLAGKAEVKLAKFLQKDDDAMDAETLAKILKVLYGESNAIMEMMRDISQKPTTSSPDSMMRTVHGHTTESKSLPEAGAPTMTADSRRRICGLVRQFRLAAKRQSDEETPQST